MALSNSASMRRLTQFQPLFNALDAAAKIAQVGLVRIERRGECADLLTQRGEILFHAGQSLFDIGHVCADVAQVLQDKALDFGGHGGVSPLVVCLE